MRLNTYDKKILHIALPSIISNITVPLLGLVDMAIVGHLGAAAYIGAIAVGGMMFNIIYWVFGFLRMGTGGMTSQAYGRRDFTEAFYLLLRSLSIAIGVGLVFIALQVPLRHLAFALIGATPDVAAAATVYFHICIWGAPAVLGLYGFTGWFLGMQNSRSPMFVAIVQNVVNIVASVCFVYLGGMKIEGVALGTLIAQYAGLFMSIGLWWRYYTRVRRCQWFVRKIWQTDALRRFFTVNRDIFLRTICLVTVMLFFTAAGARQSELMLAVNALLMQLFTLFSYVMDGFAYAGEVLTGRFIGARNPDALRQTIRRLFVWGVALAVVFTLFYGLGGGAFLSLLTDDAAVLVAATEYSLWAIAIPITGFAAFLWDGVLIGATATRSMLLTMLVAMALFFLVYYALRPLWGNHALWCAFLCYLVCRGLLQALCAPRIVQMAGR